MPIKEPDSFSMIGSVIVVAMTLLGTLANYAWRILNGERFRLSFFLLKICISIFAGALVLLAASYSNWEAEIAGGVAGLAGWSGAEAIRIIEKRFLSRLRRDKCDENQ
ncbi:phage holin family protein [Enterobacillus tribolii]|uniref:LydA family holin superfamily III n=1 Tax=Enterobacillus tribolii TaxID=1487935 RepID=A0A370R2Q1_9GAMM|nr:phage holin family protein [Enterobacillus tribolii]RDK96719.1 LydA family holin superfamily III [Enterobacillus tribolii]